MLKKHHIVFLDSSSVGNDVPWPDFSKFGTVDNYEHSTPEEALERIKKATILLTNKVYLTKQMIDAAPNLAYIGTLATGYNQVDIKAAAARNIPVCNVPDYSTPSVAQHVFTLILALAAHLQEHTAAVADGEWSNSKHFCFWKSPTMELAGKTLGIVGFGNTGQAVATLGHHFGMHILAHAPRPKPTPGYSPFAFTGLDELFKKADVVSLHCPLTPENTHLVDAKRLATMKKSAYFINCSRGPLVNDEDLITALKQGTIAGAALDVVTTEPMPLNDPLRFAPHCLITPHIAWATVEARTRLVGHAFANVQAFLKGAPTNICNGVTLA